MPAVDPRTPVLVGAGQFMQKPADPAAALEPLAMMVTALEAAATDAGSTQLLSAADVIRVVKGAWPYRNPGQLVAERLGATPKATQISTDGGNTPQSLVNASCLDILAGRADVVLLVGAEGIWSRRRAKKAGVTIPYTADAGAAPAEVLGHDVPMSSQVEVERGVEMPVNVYPVFENALRAERGESIAAHRTRIAELWSRFNAVAVQNPYAWLRTPLSAAEIREASPTNRMVGFPYTKSMNSNWDLDQSAAVILCSAEAAERVGVSKDNWVFPWSGTDAHDTYLFSNRDNFRSSPAIRTAGRVVFELGGVTAADVAHVDLYSCFPSAVQIAANELGFSHDRQLTVTGGLPFAGGPLNNYVMHSIATMAGVLRSHPGDIGLCSANGGYVTKHAIGLYSTTPPAQPFRHRDVQDEVDRVPTRELDPGYRGPATVESYTVMHDHEGPQVAIAAVLSPSGTRNWARSRDVAAMASMMTDEPIGRAVDVHGDAEFSFV